jgi:hypothetical protein
MLGRALQFYTHVHINCAVAHPLYNYMFQTVIFAALPGLEIRLMQIFLLFFRNIFSLFTDILI